MAYRVIIMPPAKRRLDRYVQYTLEELKNKQAASAILADGREPMTRPTFSILVDTEENTNLAIKQLTQIALEQGIITEQELEEMEKRKTPATNPEIRKS
jgi:hypothetical protein